MLIPPARYFRWTEDAENMRFFTSAPTAPFFGAAFAR